MEELNDDCVKKFDAKYSSNKIACLKIISTHVTPSVQNLLAVYIKFLEIKFCISRLDNHINFNEIVHCTDQINIPNLINDIMPFLSPTEQEKVSQIRQTITQIEHYQSLFSTFQMMQDLFGDGKDNPFGNLSSDMDMSELSSMMELFQNFNL